MNNEKLRELGIHNLKIGGGDAYDSTNRQKEGSHNDSDESYAPSNDDDDDDDDEA